MDFKLFPIQKIQKNSKKTTISSLFSLRLIDNKKWHKLAVGPTTVSVFLHAPLVLTDYLYNKIYFNDVCLKGLLYPSWIISLLSCDLL